MILAATLIKSGSLAKTATRDGPKAAQEGFLGRGRTAQFETKERVMKCNLKKKYTSHQFTECYLSPEIVRVHEYDMYSCDQTIYFPLQ